MRALILAGGLGSRLRPFTVTIPKPLVPVGDIPILELLIQQLRGHGFGRITLSVGYQASLIEAFCGDGSRWGIDIDYVRETEPLGTAGCLSLIDDLDASDRILVTNGDILTDLDFRAVHDRHDPADGATVCANQRVVNIEFGVLETDATHALTEYREKPQLSYRVSMGVNVLSTDAVAEHVAPNQRLDMPDLLQLLRDGGRPVRVVDTDAYWLDMGRMADLEEAQRVFAAEPERFITAAP